MVAPAAARTYVRRRARMAPAPSRGAQSLRNTKRWFSPSWNRRWRTRHKSPAPEDLRHRAWIEAVVLVRLHAVDDPQPDEDVEDLVDPGRRCGDHERATRNQHLRHSLRPGLQHVTRSMLDDGQHRHRVEQLAGGHHVAGTRRPATRTAAPIHVSGCCRSMPTPRRDAPARHRWEQRAVRAADIEHQRNTGSTNGSAFAIRWRCSSRSSPLI